MQTYLALAFRLNYFSWFPLSALALMRETRLVASLILCIALLLSNVALAQSLSETDQASFNAAIANKDIAALPALLKKGASAQTLMFAAIDALNSDMLNLAIEAGADTSSKNNNGDAALHALSRMKFTEAATLRLEGVLTKAQISEHIQSRAVRLDMVDQLVSQGGDINALNDQGETPISLAFSAEQALLVDYYIANKADPKVGPNLFRKAGAHVYGNTYLKFLLDYGYSAKPEKGDTTTPLHLLAKHTSDKAMLQLFVDYGADVNAKDANGNTPLLLSLSPSNPNQDEAREALVSLGADVPQSYKQMQRQSTLSRLIDQRDHVAVLDFIQQHPTTVNGIDQEQKTPLMTASEGSLKLTRLLLANDADLNVRSNGLNALDTAIASGHDYIARYLIKEGIDVNAFKSSARKQATHSPALTAAVKANNPELVKLLLENGATTEHSSVEDTHPLVLAVKTGELSLVELLASAGFDVNIKTDAGSLVDVANQVGAKPVAAYLNSVGVD